MSLKSILRPLEALTAGLYLLVFFEALYMVSVFGIYLTAVYAPVERLLDSHPATSWLLSFYLPHFYRSPIPIFRTGAYLSGAVLFWFLGFFIFFLSALQIYGTKLTGGTSVTNGFYRWVRHPQYLAFMTVPVPFLFMWPRYLLLGLYVLLVFFYVGLARREERACVLRFGKEYLDYQASTAMFLPGIPLERLASVVLRFPRRSSLKALVFLGAAVAATAMSLYGSFSLARIWSGTVPQYREEDALWVPLLPDDGMLLRRIQEIATGDPSLVHMLDQIRETGGRSFFVLVIPWGEEHFFNDYCDRLRPTRAWDGVPSGEYWASPVIAEVPQEAFRSLVFYSSDEAQLDEEPILHSIVFHAGKWIPRCMAGLDIRAGQVVSRVLLEKDASSSRSTVRLPLF